MFIQMTLREVCVEWKVRGGAGNVEGEVRQRDRFADES